MKRPLSLVGFIVSTASMVLSWLVFDMVISYLSLVIADGLSRVADVKQR